MEAAMIDEDAGLAELANRGVGEAFRGRLLGAAMLVLPEENSLDLVRAALPEDVGINPIGAVEHESLSEIGNIVLNGCLSAWPAGSTLPSAPRCPSCCAATPSTSSTTAASPRPRMRG